MINRCVKLLQIAFCVLILGITVSLPNAGAGTYNCGPPPFKTIDVLPNVLIILDNSNSMDEDFTGAAVGSASPASRSEVARKAILQLIHTYGNRLRIGLMAYKQSGIEHRYLHNSYYYAAYDPTHYDPNYVFTGADSEDTALKRYYKDIDDGSETVRVYYNQALPFYSTSNEGTRFTWNTHAGGCSGDYPEGAYRIFSRKTNTSDALNDTLGGYVNHTGTYCFGPTDDDIALGYDHFGDRMAWEYVSRTWFSNNSPGPGFLHVPCDDYTTAHETELEDKLATCQFTTATDTPIRNAGLTPLAGTLFSAKDYFDGNLNSSEAESGIDRSSPVQYYCQKNFVILVTDGLPSVDSDGNQGDGDALIPECVTAIQNLKDSSEDIATYVLGVALEKGGELLDQLAVAAGTDVDGHAYMADQPEDMFTQLEIIFQNIVSGASSGTAVAVINSTSATAQDRIFRAKFIPYDQDSPAHNPNAWIGSLECFTLPYTTTSPAVWEAGRILNDTDPADRHIYTSTVQGSTSQETFDTLNLTLTYSTLGVPSTDRDKLINYIRGGYDASWGYRARTYTDEKGVSYSSWKLGDIIYSTPAIRPEVPDEGWDAASFYTTTGAPTSSNYANFNPSRRELVIVGANDGMVHAFNVYGTSDAGHEAWAYIPFNLLKKLKYFPDPNDPYCHEYYVDLSPVVTDIQDGNDWKTILMCGEREGGMAYFALDVTQDGAGYPHPLWEFTDNELGETWSVPQIGRVTMANSPHYRWIGIFGSGYHNSDSKGYLYGIDVNTGSQIFKIKVDDETSNVMASSAAIDFDDNTCLDRVYVGDMLGRMWKAAIPDHIGSPWGDAASTSVAVLITTGISQAIRVKPVVTLFHRTGGDCPAVYFGTGKFDEIADKTTTDTQSFYCVLDEGTLPVPKSDLVNSDSPGISGYCSELGKIPATKRGWYFDLPNTGERVTSTSLLVGGIVFFTTFTPSDDPCESGGTARLYAVKYDTGCAPDNPVLDVNGDNVVDATDTSTGTAGGPVPKSIIIGNGLPSAPVFDAHNNQVIVQTSDTQIHATKVKLPISSFKINYWREVF